MTALLVMAVAAAGATRARPYFTANPVNATKNAVTPTNATAQVIYKRNGEIRNHAGTLLAYWTDKPSATVGDNFKVKAAKSSGDAFTSAAADNTYTTDISTDRTFEMTETTDGASTKQWVGNWTVSNLAGTQTATAGGTVTATVTV